MKKSVSIIFSLFFILTLILSVTLSFKAVSTEINYYFSKSDRGFAEGEISLTAPKGTYWLYWADNEKALEDYKEIVKFNFENAGTQVHKMYERCAIPENAVKIIAIESEKEPAEKNTESAAAVYSVPDNSLPEHSKRYTFASYSDIHTDAVKKNYKYDEIHWRNALDIAASRNTDFIVLSGDYVNNNVNFEGINKTEWRTYQRVLSESDYLNPVYEAIGNHEIRQNPEKETPDFIRGTGLEDDVKDSDKAYFEKTLMGDHFIFMALEKGFRPTKKQENFSEEQLNWLENLLEKYSGDGKNIYIIEHALFNKYGAGDRVDDEPYYDIPLYDNAQSTIRFKSLLEKYKDVIFVSGHTHIAFEYQYNFSDNNGTSAQMIHNSSVGGSRHIVDGKLNSNYKIEDTEGYIVDVYNDAIVFKGANLYYNKFDPNCCYIVRPSSFFTNKSSSADEALPNTNDEEFFETGDVNADGKINVNDVTCIQKHIAKIHFLNDGELERADVNRDSKVNINDATTIQKYLARIIISMDKENEETIRDKVKENLKLYYRYSSYDSYQALKKAFRTGAGFSKLSKLNSKLLGIVDVNNIDKAESMNVYFENTESWKDVYAYNWSGEDKSEVNKSPGKKLEKVGKSKAGNDIFEYKIPDKKYNMLRFTNGTDKTQDIMFYSGDVCYYIYDNKSSLKVKSYKYIP